MLIRWWRRTNIVPENPLMNHATTKWVWRRRDEKQKHNYKLNATAQHLLNTFAISASRPKLSFAWLSMEDGYFSRSKASTPSYLQSTCAVVVCHLTHDHRSRRRYIFIIIVIIIITFIFLIKLNFFYIHSVIHNTTTHHIWQLTTTTYSPWRFSFTIILSKFIRKPETRLPIFV